MQHGGTIGTALCARTSAVHDTHRATIMSETSDGADLHVVRPRLWLGSYAAASDPAIAQRRGITHVLSCALGIDALPGSAGVFPAPGVPTTLPRSASTTRGHRAVVYSTSVDHLFYVSASARNDAALFVCVGSLFASPVFLEGPSELARKQFTN